MKKLLTYLDEDEKNWLQGIIDNPGVYEMPTMEEVIEYLENTYDDESSEEVMGDLIISYRDEEGWEGLDFDFC